MAVAYSSFSAKNGAELELVINDAWNTLTNLLLTDFWFLAKDEARRLGVELAVILRSDPAAGVLMTNPYQVRVFEGQTIQDVETQAQDFLTTNPTYFISNLFTQDLGNERTTNSYIGIVIYNADAAGGLANYQVYSNWVGAATDEFVKVSGADLVQGYLSGKIAAGTNIALAILNPGANEQLQISATSGGLSGTIAANQVAYGTAANTIGGSNNLRYNPVLATGGLVIDNTTPSTSTTTGALRVAGGVGIGGDLSVGDEITALGEYHSFGQQNSESNGWAISPFKVASRWSTPGQPGIYSTGGGGTSVSYSAVFGRATSRPFVATTQAIGVTGLATYSGTYANRPGDRIGVYGQAESVNGFGASGYLRIGIDGYAVSGDQFAANTIYGGRFRGVCNAAANGAVTYGLLTEAVGAASSATAYGIYASASGAVTNWAGYFAGAVNITGKLTVGGLIDPTGLELTPVAANPGGTPANTIWQNSGNSNALTFGGRIIAINGDDPRLQMYAGTLGDATCFIEMGENGNNWCRFGYHGGVGNNHFRVDTGSSGLVTRFTIDRDTGNTAITSSTASTNSTTGALVVGGGVGIGGAINVGNTSNPTGTSPVTGGSIATLGGISAQGTVWVEQEIASNASMRCASGFTAGSAPGITSPGATATYAPSAIQYGIGGSLSGGFSLNDGTNTFFTAFTNNNIGGFHEARIGQFVDIQKGIRYSGFLDNQDLSAGNIQLDRTTSHVEITTGDAVNQLRAWANPNKGDSFKVRVRTGGTSAIVADSGGTPLEGSPLADGATAEYLYNGTLWIRFN